MNFPSNISCGLHAVITKFVQRFSYSKHDYESMYTNDIQYFVCFRCVALCNMQWFLKAVK